MIRITKDQVISIHSYLIKRFGGFPGTRDDGLLESALGAAFQTFDGKFLYPTPVSRSAKLAQGLICNHPFVDGNKRVGVTVMGIYLQAEGLILETSTEDLIDFGLRIAQEENLDSLINWIEDHTSSIQH